MAGADRAAERRWGRHDGDPAADRGSKPTIWRWQARFMAEGVDGLLHDTTRPARTALLAARWPSGWSR